MGHGNSLASESLLLSISDFFLVSAAMLSAGTSQSQWEALVHPQDSSVQLGGVTLGAQTMSIL